MSYHQLFNVDHHQIERRTELLYSEFFPRSCTQYSTEAFPRILHQTKKCSNFYDNVRKMNRLKLMKLLREQEKNFHETEGSRKLEVENEILRTSAVLLEASRHISDEELMAEFQISRSLVLNDTDDRTAECDTSRAGSDETNTTQVASETSSQVRVVLHKLPQRVVDKYMDTAETSGSSINSRDTHHQELEASVKIVSEVRVMLTKLSPKTLRKYLK